MRNRWKILAPVDLGSEADARVQHALNLAEAMQGDLTLLYVIDSKIAEAVEWPRNAIPRDCGRRVRRLVLTGKVGETVARHADTMDADLIAVAAQPNPWWRRMWRRHAATGIARSTARALCYTRISGPPPAAALRSILCLVNLDGAEDGLLHFSQELAQRSDATLIFLHVLPEMSEASLAYGVRGSDRPLGREVAEHRLRELTGRLSVPHLGAIRTGSAYAAIAKLAREYGVDLVITGRSDGALAPLDPNAVLSRVSCPVMSVSTPAARPVTGHNVVHQDAAHDRVLTPSR